VTTPAAIRAKSLLARLAAVTTRTDELLAWLLASPVGKPTGRFLQELRDNRDLDEVISRVTPQSDVETLAWVLIGYVELLGGRPIDTLNVDFDFLAEHVTSEKRQAGGR
jgi:hypothetical protein